MLTIPPFGNKHRLLGLAYSAILLMWLSVEDSTLIIVSLLGAGLALLVMMLALLRWLGGRTFERHQWIAGLIVLGVLVGFGAVWCTMGLMVFKNAWHSHAYPDFAASVVLGIGRRGIAWSAVGGLVGAAAALLRLARAAS